MEKIVMLINLIVLILAAIPTFAQDNKVVVIPLNSNKGSLSTTAYQFVGFAYHTGGMNGVKAINQSCQDEYGITSRMCTSKEYWTTMDRGFVDPGLQTTAYIQPTIIAIYGDPPMAVDFTGKTWDFTKTGTCDQWRISGGSYLGMAVYTKTGHVQMNGCGTDAYVTCCSSAAQ